MVARLQSGSLVARPWEEGQNFRQSNRHADGSCWIIGYECMIN